MAGQVTTHWECESGCILCGDVMDALRTLPNKSVHGVVTSPPYWGLRDYGTAKWEGWDDPDCDHLNHPGEATGNKGAVTATPMAGDCTRCGATRTDKQLGLEETPEAFIDKMVEVFREVRRVLRSDGTCWVNMGDSYASSGVAGGQGQDGIFGGSHKYNNQKGRSPTPPGLKPKDICLMPHRLAIALQEDGWWVRSDIVWHKTSPMPESCTDRPTKSHEFIFMLAKSARYFYDQMAASEPSSGGAGTRNSRSVWTIAPQPFTGWTQTSRQVLVAQGDVSCGMTHKVSGDCPEHGSQDHHHPTGACGGHEDDQVNHTEGSTGREQLPEGERESTGHCNEQDSQEQSSGSGRRGSSLSAIGHNNQSHKTDPAPETNPAYTSCDETSCHTECTPTEPGNNEPSCRKRVSNTWGDCASCGKEIDLSEQTLCRTVDTSTFPIPPECTCSFYQDITERASHFATFPEEIPRRCIAAGTSERGCCPACRAPWERVVERTAMVIERSGRGEALGKFGKTAASGKMVPPATSTTTGWRPTCDCQEHLKACGGDKDGEYHGESVKDYEGTGAQVPGDVKRRILEGIKNPKRTVGWQQTCDCPPHDPVPCVCLDPFFGSGTSGLVAYNLGRHFIGIDLNPEYCDIAQRRLEKAMCQQRLDI